MSWCRKNAYVVLKYNTCSTLVWATAIYSFGVIPRAGVVYMKSEQRSSKQCLTLCTCPLEQSPPDNAAHIYIGTN